MVAGVRETRWRSLGGAGREALVRLGCRRRESGCHAGGCKGVSRPLAAGGGMCGAKAGGAAGTALSASTTAGAGAAGSKLCCSQSWATDLSSPDGLPAVFTSLLAAV